MKKLIGAQVPEKATEAKWMKDMDDYEVGVITECVFHGYIGMVVMRGYGEVWVGLSAQATWTHDPPIKVLPYHGDTITLRLG